MKRLRKIAERTIEFIFSLSGATMSVITLLITLFLFSEGWSLFKAPAVEEGYALYVHTQNRVSVLSIKQTKQIFDGEVTNWKELGGEEGEIQIFRVDDIFALHSEEELGSNYELLPQKLAEYIANTPNVLAFLPKKYMLEGGSLFYEVSTGSIHPKDFFLATEWMPTATPAPLYGALPLVLGTLLVSFVAILLALPLGLGVAIYLSELAHERTRKILKPAIELLAGIPSVVYGFWGLVVLVPWVQRLFNLPVGETAFTGSIILAIMALPTIISVAQDALSNTPISVREASLALGATSWQTIYKVVVPYSKSGLSAAVVLGIGRAVGETMAVLMVTGNAAVMPSSLFESVRTIPATIVAELGEVPMGSTHYQALFLLGCILFVFTLIISVSAEFISKRQHRTSL